MPIRTLQYLPLKFSVQLFKRNISSFTRLISVLLDLPVNSQVLYAPNCFGEMLFLFCSAGGQHPGDELAVYIPKCNATFAIQRWRLRLLWVLQSFEALQLVNGVNMKRLQIDQRDWFKRVQLFFCFTCTSNLVRWVRFTDVLRFVHGITIHALINNIVFKAMDKWT